MKPYYSVLANFSIFACLVGCGGAETTYGDYTKADLERELGERLGLSDVTLVDQGEGRFTGTGKKEEEVHQLEVTRKERSLEWTDTYTSDDGSSGSKGSGGVQLR